MSKMPINNRLKACSLFDTFSDDEFAAIESAMAVTTFPDGHVFLRQGTPLRSQTQEAMYVILEGVVDIYVNEDSESNGAAVETISTGSAFGIMSLISPESRSATCVARGEVLAGILNKPAFDYLFVGNETLGAKFRFALIQQLARDLRAANHALHAAIGEMQDGV